MNDPHANTVERCRDLRRKSTKSERLLWSMLRGKQLGQRFRRQHPLGPYVADFYCHARKLVVEVDGSSHESECQRERDALRDEWMRARGYRVVRLSDAEVNEDVSSVVARIGRLI